MAEPNDFARSPSGSTPRSVGGYRMLRRIGAGAMSDVYLGYDPAGLRPAAVKLLGEHLAGKPPFVERFYREARMSRAFEHPNLVRGQSHGYDTDAGRHFLILEYVDGPNALALLEQNGPLPVPLVARIAIEIARALEYLHGRNYVHRDVKPENVLVAPDGTAKLGDLGLARRLNQSTPPSTGDDGVGTPHYMPYEQAVNGVLVDARSDLFALGATLYHLLTGHVPFPGQTHEEIVREKARGTFRPARVLRPDVPVELDRLLGRMLARNPQNRIQSAAELIARLDQAGLDRGDFELTSLGVTASLNGAPLDTARTHTDLAFRPDSDRAVPASRSQRCTRLASLLDSRKRRVLVMAAVITGFVGLGGTWAVLQSRTPGESPRQLPTAADETGPIPPSVLPDPEYNKLSGPASGG